MPGNFVLFSPPKLPLTKNHFENDPDAFNNFDALCKNDPHKTAPRGGVGFKRDVRTLRNFLWKTGDNHTEKYVQTSIKGKILGAQGKGKKRLFFRSVMDTENRYMLHVPCHYDPMHLKLSR